MLFRVQSLFNLKKMNEYKLVNGEFSAEEAQKIIMSLINSKIDFHNLIAFSNHIRFNNDVNASQKRIEELTASKDEIIELIRKGNQYGHRFKIKSTISIELI